ncbi:unnamed protein product, partial [Allacma fusca]
LQIDEKEIIEKVVWDSSQLFKVNPGQCEWWKSTVVYEVYVRSFYDSNDDGIGDLQGIRNKLDYFVDIGVETLWLSPIYKSPMKDFGYDISDFTTIDPIFGNLEDFKELMASMKEKKLRLIMDFVPNHTSDQHEWFTKSCQKIEPYTNYYVWLQSKGMDDIGKPIPPNNWVSVFGGSIWEWSPEIRNVLDEYTKKDGHPRLMMTEAYLSCADLLKYYGTKEAPIASFPFNFDFISNLKKGFNAREVFKIVTSWVHHSEDGHWPNWVLGNHDMPRV